MIKHIVFFKMPNANKELAKDLQEKLESMVGNVTSLLTLETGLNCVESERSFDLALTVTLDNLDALKQYAVDPYHQTIVAWIKENSIETKVVDYLF